MGQEQDPWWGDDEARRDEWAGLERDRIRDSVLAWLQAWACSVGSGPPGSGNGVRLETLDNPGWSLKIELPQTPLVGQPFPRTELVREEHDWLHMWVEDDTFQAFSGPLNLTGVLASFRDWALGCDGVADLIDENGLRGIGPNSSDPLERRWDEADLWPQLSPEGADNRGLNMCMLDPTHLSWLQGWYAVNCDDDWEHGFGVSVGTVEGGWEMAVELRGTVLAGQEFREVRAESGPHWMRAWVDRSEFGDVFRTQSGPFDLSDAIYQLRRFFEGVSGR